MIDITSQIVAIHREAARKRIGNEDVISVLLRRGYDDAPIASVWHALVDPDRLKRWFLPIGGDLCPGGSFQLEGNAGGKILACEARGSSE
jgi:hypothetical protein